VINALLIVMLMQAGPARPPAVPDRATLLARAGEALQRGNRAEAKQMLGTAGQRYSSVRAWLQLARLESEDGRATEAMRALTAARTLAPNAEEVLAAVAELSLRVQSPVPAILALESLTRMYPAESRYAYLLGVGLMAAGDTPAALDVLRKANALEPDRPLTLLALGLACNNQKLFTDSRPLLRRALDLDPQSVETLAALSEAEAGDGDMEAAERNATRVLARDARNATANLVIGMVRMTQQRYAEARDALVAAASADPRSPKPEYQLSLVYARMGDQASSERHLAQYRDKLRAMEAAVKALHDTGRGGQE
jgi:tetratricopeptide (TPR) repeat protein